MSALGQKQTFALRNAMSALCQKRTSRHLFDHLVACGEQLRMNCEAKRLAAVLR